jgi:hypothetical protein
MSDQQEIEDGRIEAQEQRARLMQVVVVLRSEARKFQTPGPVFGVMMDAADQIEGTVRDWFDYPDRHAVERCRCWVCAGERKREGMDNAGVAR